MYILGINGGVRAGYQDVSTVLVQDGRVIYAIDEERLNRKKHSAGQLPYLGIIEALKFANIAIEDIDYLATHGSTWGEQYEVVLKEYMRYHFGHCPKIVRVHHHMAHAASAYYGSGYDEAMILTMDASGDGIAIQKAKGKEGKIEILEQIPRSNSLGIFYSMMTQFCGFTRDTDEYKLMGLAAYGNPTKISLDEVLEVGTNGFKANPDFLKTLQPGAPQGSRQQAAFSDKLFQLLGEPRLPSTPFSDYYKDVAAASQQKLEEAILSIVKSLHEETGLRRLCLAGGVALNCEVNQQLMNLDFIDAIFVQPASGDDGISLGAAWLVSEENGQRPIPPSNYYLGNLYTNDDLLKCFELTGVQVKNISNPAKQAAELVAQDKVIAWFQGRDEFGPRALGARSILANPQHPDMKHIINKKIKFREGFRPFCPSVLEEDAMLYFDGKQAVAPHMTINYQVKAGHNIPSITHVNNTARIQTVNKDQNPLYYAYLRELKKNIGLGMSINTSFNRNQEPMIHNPIEAISAFYGSGMEAMIIGDFLLEK